MAEFILSLGAIGFIQVATWTQLIRSIRLKKTAHVSPWLPGGVLIGVICYWLLTWFYAPHPAYIISNSIGLLSNSIWLWLTLKYRR